jgi:phosphoserine phosphatase RsbU/P
MRMKFCWLAICLLASSLGAVAQLPARGDVVVLDAWRMQDGDNLAWARPELDDAGWRPIGAPLKSSALVISNPGYHWLRTTATLPSVLAGRDLAIGLGPTDEVFEVYVEGVSIGRFGHWDPRPASPFDRNLTFAIPPGLVHGSEVHIAVRAWTGKSATSLFPFYMSGASRFTHPPELGMLSTISDRTLLYSSTGIVRNLPWGICLFSTAMAGCVALVLFSVQRNHREYLFLGIYCIGTALVPLAGGILAANDSVMRRSMGPAIVTFAFLLFHASAFAFLGRLCPRFRRWLDLGAILYTLLGVLTAWTLYAEASYTNRAFWQVATDLPILFFVVAIIGLFMERKRWSFAIAVSLLMYQLTTALVNSLSASRGSRLRFLPFGPFVVDVRAIFELLFVFVTLIVLFLRYREEQSRQIALERDMASARRMQEQLLGNNSVAVAGFVVEAAYLPAQEVGGDFYRTVALADGSLLVAVGDVSGKGLDAAMLVAAVLGSLANETHRSPASLLGYLNRAVAGRTGGGFITACCAVINPDGRTVVANAGHIAPYLNNRELEVENGLPLGVTPEASYSETELRANGALTFVSDGVVEACDANGELLGFERTAALTGKSASEIAEAAMRWGQADDITVLRIAFAGTS